MKIAYLDCFSGISGDMFLGALIEAGLPFEELKLALSTLPLEGYQLEVCKEEKNGLYGTRFTVKTGEGNHPHRKFSDIRSIISAGDLSDYVKTKSLEIFEAIAIVEGEIHGCPSEEVYFHEIGAVDSIIDIVGAVFGIDLMGISSLFSSPLPLGSGFIKTDHGRIPVPAPATIALLKKVPVYSSGLNQELVTPTGAALLKGLAQSFGPMPPMTVESVGYGSGTKDLPDRPNLLRMLVGEELGNLDVQTETVVVLETNLDDMNPEWTGHIMDLLFDEGALDVVFSPLQMKKNRPGVLLQVIGNPQDEDKLARIIFKETTSIGVRFRYNRRKVLERSITEVESPWGILKIKKIIGPGGAARFLPEFEDCRKIASQKGLPLKEIYNWVATLNISHE